MAYIKLELDYEITDGQSLTFKAPCDSTAVSGIKVYYKALTESSAAATNKTFAFKDAHGNDISSLGNLFTTDAYVNVILDTTNGCAYIQNADTNGYLESKIPVITSGTTDLTAGTSELTTGVIYLVYE